MSPVMAGGPRAWGRPRRRDVGVAAAAAVLDVVAFSAVLSVPPAVVATILVYAVCGHVAVAWRSVAPYAVFAVMWVHGVVAFLVVPQYGPTVGLLVALYGLAARANLRDGVLALVATVVPNALRVLAEVTDAPPGRAVATVAVTSALIGTMVNAAVWSAGRWARRQRERAEELERQRERTAREAVARERVRIARELHDIISHSVSVMSLQAGGARAIVRASPERAEQALADIQASGAHAMVQLRRLLVVLRADGDHDVLAAPDDQGGVADVADVLDGVRAAGIPARLRVTGDARDVDAAVGLTVYRVVQEALTNVVAHAGPGTDTEVTLTWDEDTVVVDVRNAPPPRRPPQPRPGRGGTGLIGMRERVTAVGGELRTGPTADGGFRVTATVPVTPDPGGDPGAGR